LGGRGPGSTVFFISNQIKHVKKIRGGGQGAEESRDQKNLLLKRLGEKWGKIVTE